MILEGDCRDVLAALPDACVDAVVTDPPYGLSREPDATAMLMHWLAGDDYTHRGGGFMGKSWDSFVPGPATWREVLRVLRPGGHVLSFFGSRTYDLGVLAMRIAGFEIRDQIEWLYGTGFPKSKNVAMSIDKGEGIIEHRSVQAVTAGGDLPPPDRSVGAYVPDDDTPGAAWQGWGTALKPAHEPIVLARKPLIGTVAANVMAHGTGGINIDACRIGTDDSTRRSNKAEMGYHGGNIAESYETGSDLGRWPANVILDPEAAAALDEQTGTLKAGVAVKRNLPDAGAAQQIGLKAQTQRGADEGYGDTGGASRFFYCAKASKAEREAGLEAFADVPPTDVTGRKEGSAGQSHARAGMTGKRGRRNTHPTVKPIDLMRYLVRLITPPGGCVLDPFVGSGTTGCAAALERVAFIGIELSADYAAIARARIAHWGAQ